MPAGWFWKWYPEKQSTFCDVSTCFHAKWRLRNKTSVLMKLLHVTTQIWVVARHQCENFCARFSDGGLHLARKPDSKGVRKCRLYSQTMKSMWFCRSVNVFEIQAIRKNKTITFKITNKTFLPKPWWNHRHQRWKLARQEQPTEQEGTWCKSSEHSRFRAFLIYYINLHVKRSCTNTPW